MCFFALLASSICLAQSNQTESLTVTTYYPSPHGVYRYLKLSPADSPPGTPSPGSMYYNNSSDSIWYNDSNSWVELKGGEGGGGNGTYWNRTSGPPYGLYNNNTGFVGIRTQTPEAPLTVLLTDNNVNNAHIVGLKRHYNGSAFPDLYLRFKAYPANTGGYLNATSVMYVPESPHGNLEFLAVNNTQHIRFNIGNFTDPYSEIMRLRNPIVSECNPRVGIGTTDPAFPLQIDQNYSGIGALGVRGTSDGRRTGFFNISPWQNCLDLTYGTYWQNGGWVNDPFEYIQYGNLYQNHYQAKFVLYATGAWWYGGSTTSGSNSVPWPAGWNFTPPVSGNPGRLLWDVNGTWRNCVCPSSSRKLKEKFVKIRSDDILRKIDRLEVSRWKYKSDDKSVSHIGPVAEDFNRLFKTGSREDELHLIDSIGVSLAGVKALSGKINAQEREIEELEGQVRGLRALLSK